MKFIINRFSLLDYANEISCILFTYGCNLKCPYCYNLDCYFHHNTANTINEIELFTFLDKRKEKLSAVVFSGGEPTLNISILETVKKIKKLNFKIKLFTNGTNIEKLKLWSPFLDSIDMSIKTTPDKYYLIGDSGKDILNSIKYIENNFINYNFTVVQYKDLCNKKDISKISNLVNKSTIKQNRLTIIKPKLNIPILINAYN